MKEASTSAKAEMCEAKYLCPQSFNGGNLYSRNEEENK